MRKKSFILAVIIAGLSFIALARAADRVVLCEEYYQED
jgi:hypothetical protein